MSGLLLFFGCLLALVSLNGHEHGEAFTQVEWAQLAFAALFIILGVFAHGKRGDV